MAAVERGRPPPHSMLVSAARGLLGGVIVADSSAVDPRAVLNPLQRAARSGGHPALLVAVDQEGGEVRRVTDAPPIASAAHLGRGPLAHTERVARAAGCVLRREGITLDLAPVADSASLGSGFISTSDRAFGSTAGAVAGQVSAFVHGLHRGGVGSTLKHFPGLGSMQVSTDVSTTALSPDPGPLTAFRAGVRASSEAVMVASATYAAGPFATGRPAVVSATVIARLRSLGFAGAVITDDLGAPGVRGAARFADVAVRAVGAGVDVLLYVDPTGEAARQARRALVEAVRADRLPRTRLVEAYRRVLALKHTLAARSARADC